MASKKVYGYVRVSTDTQSEKGYGIETQRQAITKHCADNGYELLEIYEDRGISGTEAVESDGDELISKRTGLLQLLSALNGANTVIVLNTSRLWRSDIAKVLIRQEIKRKGGDVISIEQPRYSIYVKDPNEILINGMFELLDEYERVSISLKLAKGRTTKATRGDKPAGVTPYGYRYADDKKSVIVDEGEAAIVKKIFSRIQAGKSIQAVADELNADGIPTRRGYLWTKGSIHTILTNKFYTGMLTHQNADIKGNHAALVSKIQFGKVSAQLSRRHK